VVIVAPVMEDGMLHDLLLFDLGQLAMALILAATDLGVVPTSVVYRRDAGGRLPMAVWGRAKL
jgi:hypothetical protein